MSQVKPTIVFVPGAWHTTACYSALASVLEAAGYTTKMVDLKSVGGEPVPGFEPDVEGIRSAIESACDADQDVILFAHSDAGVCGSEAVKNLDKASRRKEGKKGGIVHLIYCSAFILPEGAYLMAPLSSTDLPWMNTEDNKMVVHAVTPDKIVYNDLGEAAQKNWGRTVEAVQLQVYV
jgi:alpha-beta hydrolase superfamily lysophospholipase